MRPSQTILRCIGRIVVVVLAFASAAFAQETNCLPRPPGLAAWWPGDGTALDVAGSNHGTLQNGAAFAPGVTGLAFSFDGDNDFVEVPQVSGMNFGPNSPMTAELWAYRTSPASIMHFIGKRDGCGAINFQMAFDQSAWGWGGDAGNAVVAPTMPLNTWVHLAGTFDGTTFRFYTNGQLAAAGPGSLGPATTHPLTIGASGSCGWRFAGLIDEVAIYNRALTSTEVTAIYTAGSSGKCRPPAVVATNPRNGMARVPTNAVITATFSKPMDAATITAANFLLADSQRNSVPGTVLYDEGTLTATFTPSIPLLESNYYSATIKTNIQDTGGESMIADYSWRFATTGFVSTIWWIGGGGDWSNPANWSEGSLPGPEDDVLIDDPNAELTITLSSGNQNIRSLVSRELLRFTGGLLAVTETMQIASNVILAGGTIRGGHGDDDQRGDADGDGRGRTVGWGDLERGLEPDGALCTGDGDQRFGVERHGVRGAADVAGQSAVWGNVVCGQPDAFRQRDGGVWAGV